MADYSIPPQDQLLANLQKGYVGLHIQQGVPLLDRDLNLLHDLITAMVRSVFTRYIGNGIPAGADGFAIQALPSPQNVQDFTINAGTASPGTCLAGGIEVNIPANLTYKSQAGLPSLTMPTAAQPDPRTDIVYLDVFFVEVDATSDPDLKNPLDIGIQTAVRVKPAWVVRVSEAVPVPTAPAGHVYYPIAQFRRPRNVNTVDALMITDLRQRRLTASDMERRLALMERLLMLPSFMPSPNQFAPKLGQPGQPVNLSGRNFNIGNVTVAFGGQTAAVVGTPTTSLIATAVPAGGPTGNVKITVTTEGGTVVSDDFFNVLPIPPPPPAPSFVPVVGGQFNPKLGPANQPVNLNGSNFDQPGLQVTIGGVACPLNGVVTAILIPIRIPAGVAPGLKPFVVTTVGGIATSTDLFSVS